VLLKQKITSLIKRASQLSTRVKILTAAIFFIILIFFAIFLQDKVVRFSYASSTCVQQLTFLPSLSKSTKTDSGFTFKNDDIMKLGNVQLLSFKTCFSAKKVPKVGDTRLSIAPFGGWIAKKTFRLKIPKPPVVSAEVLTRPIPIIRPLEIALSDVDSVFDYQLEVGERTANCPHKDSAIYCDVASLQLVQGQKYDVKLVRLFDKQKVATLVSKSVETLVATNVASSSVSQGQVIYDKPKTFTFDFDKEVIKGDVVLEKIEGEKRTIVPSKVVLAGKRSTVAIESELNRDTTYEFSIDKLEAKDGSTLPVPYKLNFKMSDGPSVANVNVGPTGLSLSKTIVLTFDQPVAENQDITKFVSTSGVPTSISRSKDQVFVRYDNAPICADLNINIKPGLTSTNGIVQNDPWSFSTRTICHTTSVIGYSVLGRSILAYTFGSGSTTVLFTGGIHGSEPSGSYIMHDFISYLESNAKKIPANKKIVVVPEVNPDGLAASSRYNANNVNIDRNFPSYNWTPNIDTSSGLIVNGGGSSALSEPETKALANLTSNLQPRLEVSFHARGNLVGANQAGDSVSIGNMYASSVGYRSMIGQAEETMGYSITGEYEDWAGEQGIPAILIELPTSNSRHFWAHQSILWRMVNI